MGYDRPAADPADDDVLGASEPLATVTSHAYLGVCFGDRTSLAPWSWIDTLAQAMIDADEATADVSAWAALGTLYAGAHHVRVLDHAGRPANGRVVDVRITPAGGGATEGPFALTLPVAPADADLEVAATRDLAAAVTRRGSRRSSPPRATSSRSSGAATPCPETSHFPFTPCTRPATAPSPSSSSRFRRG